MQIRQAFAKLEDVRRRHGAHAALRSGWAAVKGKVFGSRRIFLFALTDPRPTAASVKAARDHEFRFATHEELEWMRWRGDLDIGTHNVEAGLRGDRCLLQMDGDMVAGYTWAHDSPLVFLTDGLHFNLPDDTAYESKSFTVPEYRGHGFQSLRAAKLLEKLRPEGKTRLFAYVEQVNESSLKGIEKNGYRKVGEIRLVRGRRRVRAVMDVPSSFWCDVRRQ